MDVKQQHSSTSRMMILFVIMMIVLMIIQFSNITLFHDAFATEMVKDSLLRFLAGSVFIVMLVNLGESKLFQWKKPLYSFLIVIPGFLIALNNFPIIAFFSGRVSLSSPVYTVYLFAIECLSIGFFEEIIFRGMILLFILQRLSRSKRSTFYAIILSSVIFSATHLLNLFGGASLGNTLMQMGYSFLTGMMWATLYLKTKNLWVIMLLHATYNFFGMVMFQLGTVTNRYDDITIIITIVLGVLTALYCIKLLITMDEKEIYSLLQKKIDYDYS
ncbi:MAG: CPBP family intramembrane metalloprotease [Firmicutes bacterium]|nr:CPBP family intramembrane metalloprotease [Bacillota bacterium]